MKKTILLAIIYFFISGCTQPSYIGLTVPYSPGETWFDNTATGHHHVTLEHLVFDYNYSIDEATSTIRMKGHTNCNKKNVTDWDQASVRITVALINNKRKIIAYKDLETGELNDDTSLCEKRSFDITLVEIQDLHAARWGYSIKMRQ